MHSIKKYLTSIPLVTPASIRAEGVLEIGRVAGTSILFVMTKQKMHLFHASSLPDRVLDDYAINLAVNWIEDGIPSFEVADRLGVNDARLRCALADAGYERLTALQMQQRTHARMLRKLERPGNRRGRLVRVRPEESA